MEYLIVALILIFIFIVLNLYLKYLLYKNIENNLNNTLRNTKFTITKPKTSGCDWLIETDEYIYICKLFIVNISANLIITNPTTWILTRDSEAIKIENRIKQVEDFVNFLYQTDKKIEKVAIIHPGIKQIRKYINENEMIIISLNEKVNNYRFIGSKNLNSIFHK